MLSEFSALRLGRKGKGCKLLFLRVTVLEFDYSAVSLVLAVQAARVCSESVLTSETVLLLTRWDYFVETGLPDSISEIHWALLSSWDDWLSYLSTKSRFCK